MKFFNIFLVSLFLLHGSRINGQAVIAVTRSPASAATIPFSGSSFPFINTSNIFAGTGDFASATALLSLLSGKSDHLQAKDFGFAIPATAIINGIEAKITRSAAGINLLSVVHDATIQLIKGGSIAGADASKPDWWGVSAETMFYGGATSNWSTSWTPDEINSPEFGLSIGTQISGLLSLLPTAKIHDVQLTVSYSMPVILSAHLLSFEAKREGEATHLSWKMAEPGGSTSFGIERSVNGTTWNSINARIHNDGNNQVSGFSSKDNNAVKGISYYRLKLISNGLSTTYSRVVTVIHSGDGRKLSVYPNPARTTIHISGENMSNVTIYNSQGVMMKKDETVDSDLARFDIQSFPRGPYIVKTSERTLWFIKE